MASRHILSGQWTPQWFPQKAIATADPRIRIYILLGLRKIQANSQKISENPKLILQITLIASKELGRWLSMQRMWLKLRCVSQTAELPYSTAGWRSRRSQDSALPSHHGHLARKRLALHWRHNVRHPEAKHEKTKYQTVRSPNRTKYQGHFEHSLKAKQKVKRKPASSWRPKPKAKAKSKAKAET